MHHSTSHPEIMATLTTTIEALIHLDAILAWDHTDDSHFNLTLFSSWINENGPIGPKSIGFHMAMLKLSDHYMTCSTSRKESIAALFKQCSFTSTNLDDIIILRYVHILFIECVALILLSPPGSPSRVVNGLSTTSPSLY